MPALLPYVPYSHGEPLRTIPEEVEPMESATHIHQLPSELLSKIIAVAANSASSRVRAHTLLSLSHVDTVFRRTSLTDPTLWNSLFLNDIHPKFFEAILERSSTLPLSLSLIEDETLCANSRVWKLLIDSLPRIQSLNVQVNEEFCGMKTKLLLTFLTVEAPVLKDCSVRFHGQRSVALNCFILDDSLQPGGSRTPLLQKLELVNCFIPLDRCRLPRLATVILRSIDCEPILRSPEECFRFRSQFQYLRRLVLYNPFQQPSSSIHRLPPVDLPVLQSLTILASGPIVKDLAIMLHLPSQCNRSVTILFPWDRGCTIDDATTAATAATSFIPRDVVYASCFLKMDNGSHSLKLCGLPQGQGPSATIHFIVDGTTKFSCTGPLSFFLRSLTSLPPFPWLSQLNMGSLDIFSFSLWQSFTSSCQEPLASPRLLSFSCDTSSPAPFIFNPIFQLLENVQTLTTLNANSYANPFFIEVAGSEKFLPKLKSLEFPLKSNSIDLAYVPHLLRQRSGIGHVSFCVSSTWIARMGLNSWDVLQSVIEGLAADFPESVEWDWFEL